MQAETDLAAAQQERLAFIELRVWFYGQVTRKEVVDRFGVSTAAGTRDLILYKELAPNNIDYVGKAYRYRSGFQPLFAHQAERVLSMLTSGFGDGQRLSRVDAVPHFIVPRLNPPALDTLAVLTRAITGGHAVRLRYHSMKTGAGDRLIVPHALADSGLRWHVRAYDRTRQAFRDLVITRMENPVGLPADGAAASERADADRHWQTLLPLDLVPHPAHPHPASIMRDYGMQDGHIHFDCRAALAGHVLREWQVDCGPEPDPSGRFRLRLANPGVLAQADSASVAPRWQAAD